MGRLKKKELRLGVRAVEGVLLDHFILEQANVVGRDEWTAIDENYEN